MSIQGRRACRSGRACEPRSLDEATYCVVHHSASDAREIAERTGIPYAYLMAAADPNRGDTHLQSKWIVPIAMASGNPAQVAYLARAVGGAFFLLPTVTGDHTDVVAETAKAVGEFGDVLAQVRRAIEDDRITPEEAERFSRETDEAIAVLAALRTLIQQKATRGLRVAGA